ncbi:MAG TPA: anion permease [Solirubrobacteraceae bacterium]|nr:anion permease [Solirubrobacteraceae bacterium]
MHNDALLGLVIAAALAFDFTNGFHDTANVVASSISTRALPPRTAIAIASLLNFAGAFISLKVAATIATGIINASQVTTTIAFAALIGAIAWNLLTWLYALPSSSSHALIGGVVGAMLAAVGASAIKGQALVGKVIVPALLSPLIAFVAAGASIAIIYWLVRHRRPGVVNRGFRAGQVISGSMLALAHGTNDAQKTMGVMSLALLANGNLSSQNFHVPTWVVVSAASAIALGTYAGGWRIIRTVGSRIIKMDTAQGFASQGAGAAVILASSHFGYPLSSTHVISGGIMGAGAAKRFSAVRWGVAGNIVAAWTLTIPGAGLFAAGAWWLADLLGTGVLGPLVIAILALGGLAVLGVVHRQRVGAPLATEGRS